MTDTPHRAGLLYALGGFVLLSCGDAVIKTMAGMWPPTAIAATRYIIGAFGLSAMLLVREGKGTLRPPLPWMQLVRGAAVALATVSFFSAIFAMPLAAATAITFTSPMLTALLAAVLLGEPARRETWIACIVAFAGVLIVLRPNFVEAGWAALLPLASAVGMSVLMIANRFVAGRASSLAMQAYIAVAATAFLGVATLVFAHFVPERFALSAPHWSVIARCALVACTASTAHWLIYLGTARAGAATVAPMTYVQLLVATLLGWLVFGNHPDALTLLGAMVIVGAGLYLWRAGRAMPPAEPEGTP